MQINNIRNEPIKPTQPAAPLPPPGGNIENRKPPAEPNKPSAPVDPNQQSLDKKMKVDIYI
ncbi:MAG: hypothetical protein JW908_10780 [Anaerolineales bacterium]|nr:hypothetical protein [Anaerolineales bacterium]